MNNRSAPVLAALLMAVSGLLAACSDSATAPEAASQRPSLPASAQATLDSYVEATRGLLADIDAGAAPEALRSGVQSLLDQGLAVLPAYLELRPECRAYLTAAARIAELWPALDLDSIESDYHDDAALPTSADTPACYNMKDLIVHPATGLAILAQPQPDLAQLRNELAELVAHGLAVQRNP